MKGEVKVALWALTGLLAVSTVFFNAYIFLMSLWSRQQKDRKWSPSQTIVVALSVAAVAHQLLCYIWMTMDEVDTECRLAETFYTVMLLCVHSLKFSVLWDASFLTFYYSTKLVSTPNRCYTGIQAAILKHVAAAVCLIPLCGLGTCMPMLVAFHSDNFTAANRDCGVLTPTSPSGAVYEAVYLLLADVLPGLLMVKCCISITVHLAVHLRRMKASTNGAHGPRLGSQMRVIRMALSLIAVFILFLVIDLYVNYEISVNHENIIGLTFLFTSIYTSVTGVVLIYGKKTFWKALVHDASACLEPPRLSRPEAPQQKAEPKIKSVGAT